MSSWQGDPCFEPIYDINFKILFVFSHHFKFNRMILIKPMCYWYKLWLFKWTLQQSWDLRNIQHTSKQRNLKGGRVVLVKTKRDEWLINKDGWLLSRSSIPDISQKSQKGDISKAVASTLKSAEIIYKRWLILLMFFQYFIQHCIICRPSYSIVSENAGIEPRTVATLTSAVRRSIFN